MSWQANNAPGRCCRPSSMRVSWQPAQPAYRLWPKRPRAYIQVFVASLAFHLFYIVPNHAPKTRQIFINSYLVRQLFIHCHAQVMNRCSREKHIDRNVPSQTEQKQQRHENIKPNQIKSSQIKPFACSDEKVPLMRFTPKSNTMSCCLYPTRATNAASNQCQNFQYKNTHKSARLMASPISRRASYC